MDLVRLGLERARTASEAVDVMTGLLETCGQGGVADAAHNEAYDSSFLIADPAEAFVLETAGSDFAVARFPAGVAISNRITLEGFDRFRDAEEDTAYADVRLAASRRLLASTGSGGLTSAATAAHLRDHGTGPWGEPGADGPVTEPPRRGRADGSGVTVCMHVRGLSVTAASMIAELPAELADGAPLRVYVAPGSPCSSIYVPAFPRTCRRPAAVRPVRALRRGPVARRRRPAPAGGGRPRCAAVLSGEAEAGRGRAVGGSRRRPRRPRPLDRGRRLVGQPCTPCTAVLYPLFGLGAAIRCDCTHVSALTRRGGSHDERTHRRRDRGR